MRHKPTTYALLRLHAGLTNPLDRWHVEAVIQLLEPGFVMRPLGRRKPNPWFKQGTLARLALQMLSAAHRPLTSREITVALLAAHGVTNGDLGAVRDLIDSVHSGLKYHRGRGVVIAVGDSPMHWTLAE
jgi:hypothetical protein